MTTDEIDKDSEKLRATLSLMKFHVKVLKVSSDKETFLSEIDVKRSKQ